MSKDYYKILGVEKTATAEDIKKAFRKLAHQHHPDKESGNETKFKEINEAYQVIGNVDKRKQYDQFGADFEQQGGFGGGVGWDDFMRYARGQNGGSFDLGDLGDIFGDIFGGAFGGGGARRRQAVGNDIEMRVDLDFKEAVFGAEKTIETYRVTACQRCHGQGAEPGTTLKKCATCAGHGIVEQVQRTILGYMRQRAACPDCRGQGNRPEKTCQECTGTGVTKQLTKLRVKIPAGIDDGQAIRLDGEGEQAPYGGGAGDLYIRVTLRRQDDFQRSGNDIVSTTTISFAQAALGTKVDILTIDGVVEMKIPAGTQSSKVFRLKGKGVPQLGGSQRGDHLVTVVVHTPSKLSKAEKKLFKDLAHLHGDSIETGGLFGFRLSTAYY
ncbi:MAG: molecular chaperone DnaJ [Candidatus Kerfeldbacteria bacterium]|nr:molecular chaperone DnaJ [Candidatus Kerfeldbacteria bacterium]